MFRLIGLFFSTSAKYRTVLKTCQRPGKRNTGTAVKRFFQRRKTGTFFLPLRTTFVQNISTIVGARCLLNFSCSACVREGAMPLKSSRKYEPLTQGNGLNPNHDASSAERDVPNENCVLRNKSLSRERKQLTFFLSVYSCEDGQRRSDRAHRC